MLTERQRSILAFLSDYQSAHRVPPSTREVARQFGCTQQGAAKHVQALARHGHLIKLADGRWGLPAKALPASHGAQLFEVPVYGSIPAGRPDAQEQEPEETIEVDPAIFGIHKYSPGHFWFLRVKGDSMVGANILDGDLVALARRDPRPGDIIAALVDDNTTTLKRLVMMKGRPLLRSENPRYGDISPQRFESQGVMVGLLRRSLP